MDRFLIGSIVSVAAVAHYTTPFEMISKVLIISSALGGVIFPAFSATLGQNTRHAARIYQQGIKYLFLILFPITLIAVLFAKKPFGFGSALSLQKIAFGLRK
jgi:O-antigen/teichoic acid export membrane protein